MFCGFLGGILMGKLCSKPMIDEEFVSLGVKQSTDVIIRGYLIGGLFFKFPYIGSTAPS